MAYKRGVPDRGCVTTDVPIKPGLGIALAALVVVCAAGRALTWSVEAAPSTPTLPILVYHQIRSSGDEPRDSAEAISRDRFESQMRYLHDEGYATLKMDEVIRFLRGDRFPAKSVAIHLDDGWKSGLSAVSVLDRYGLNASFWIIAGTGIGGPHLDWDQIEHLVADPHIEVFSHTMTHPWKPNETLLDWLDGRTPGKGIDQARWELTESRRTLERKLGRPVPYLAWPGGHYNESLIRLARDAGYAALLTVDHGVNVPGGDPLRIHRTVIHGGCDDQVFQDVLTDGHFRNCDHGL